MDSDDKNQNKRDKLFASPDSGIIEFTFDSNVANVFDDMIQRSVPGYEAIVAMIGVLAERYAVEGTRCYDLGCSLGAVTINILNNLGNRDCQVIAVDNSEAMISKLRQRLNDSSLANRVTLKQEDIRDTEVSNASVVVLNFVMQFLDPAQRSPLLQKIYDGMLPGSILILSEKIEFESEQENNFQIVMHHEFKKLHGYSDLEISQKRAALEKVLIPDSEQAHIQRLKNTGFSQCYLWFKCFNFVSIVAIK